MTLLDAGFIGFALGMIIGIVSTVYVIYYPFHPEK